MGKNTVWWTLIFGAFFLLYLEQNIPARFGNLLLNVPLVFN